MQYAASADLKSLALRLSKAANSDINTAAEIIIKDAATQIQSVAQSIAPVKTGKLRNSIGIRYTSATRAVIGPNVLYGPFLEFGTGSRGEFPTGTYEIRPKKGKYLRFTTQGGKVVYTKKVTHPGIKAQPYMRPALRQVVGNMAPELVKQGAMKIVGKA